MEINPKKSIFDEAGKKRDEPSLKKPGEKPTPSLPEKSFEKNKQPLEEVDIQFMFKKMQEMRQDLDKKADELKEAIALSQVDIVKFFSDPKNFTQAQWQIIQQSRAELETRVWAVVGKDPKEVQKKHKETKEKKQRKGKTLGSRKNWIPIR